MRHVVLALFLMVGSLYAQQAAVAEIPYHPVPDFLKLPPNMYFGEVSGVAVNSKGHIFVFSRGNTTGPAYGAAPRNCSSSAPTATTSARSATTCTRGRSRTRCESIQEDNIWVTDKGSDMVIKFNPEGRVVMVFGRKQEASDEGTGPLKHPNPPLPPVDGMFRQVTDIAWDAAGNTYISDGYINSRVAKVDKNGNWLKSLGEPGDGPGQLHTPHSIAVDAQRERLRGGSRATAASRCSTATASFSDRSISTCRSIPTRIPRSGTSPTAQPPDADDGAGCAVGDLHHARAKPSALQLGRLSGAGYTS